MTERDPRSEFEDQGIPDLQDGYPEQKWAEDPQQAPVPGDEPMALDDHGTTAEEQRTGESLDDRLHREDPDVPAPEEDIGRVGRWPMPFRYTIESSPLPVRAYVAELRVAATGADASKVSWVSDFELGPGAGTDTMETVQTFLAAGLDNLQRQYAKRK